MNTKHYIFFLIPILFVSLIPLASAEIERGKNFDRELIGYADNGNLIIKWISASERLYNNGEWVNYILNEDESKIYFESARNTIIFDKSSNTIETYQNGKLINPIVDMKLSHTIKEAANGTDIWNDILVDDFSQTTHTTLEKGIQIISKKGDFETIYDINQGGFEYTYKFTNTNPNKTDHKYGFTSVCNGTACDSIILDNEIVNIGETKGKSDIIDKGIKVGKKNLDLKNEQHDYTWSLKHPEKDKLIIDFTHSKGRLAVGDTLIVDPTFTVSEDRSIREKDNDGLCDEQSTAHQFDTTNDVQSVFLQASFATDCVKGYFEFNISSIDDSTIISSSIFHPTVNAVSSTEVHDIYIYTDDQLSLEGDDRTLFLKLNDGTLVIDDQSISSTGTKNYDLGTTGNTEITAQLVSGNDWINITIELDSAITQAATEKGVYIDADSGATPATLELTYQVAPNPDSVDDLISTLIGTTNVNLAWTEPDLNTGNLTDYQVNYTTPWSSSVNTIITNNSGTGVTSEVTGLSELTQYSFRIGVWTEGSNMTGNVLNITTVEDFTIANFTPGFFDLNATNTNVIPILFERNDINSTSLFLNVTYPNTWALACDFSYQFANINQTYSNLSNVTVSSDKIESAFQFTNVDNEIIDVYCWDENNLDNDGTYIITQTSFPLLQQIQSFRDGDYGTDGNFGALDLVTLAVVIISMIGFNRVNESVGAIFNIILLGSLAFFEIIELPTVIFGAIAVVLMLVITTTRKT